MLRNRPLPDVVTIAAAAVAVGLLPLPAGYYLLLRFFLCGLCLYFLAAMPRIRDTEKWVLTGLVILFNPIVPIEFGSRLLWNIVSAGTVVWLWFLRRRRA